MSHPHRASGRHALYRALAATVAVGTLLTLSAPASPAADTPTARTTVAGMMPGEKPTPDGTPTPDPAPQTTTTDGPHFDALAAVYEVPPAPQRPTQPRLVTPDAPKAPAPDTGPKVYTLHVAHYGTTDIQHLIDQCTGPAAINYATPLIAEHNHCGGSRNINARQHGDLISITGAAYTGLYKVTHRSTVPVGSHSDTLNGKGDLVLQTCIGGHTMVHVGLTRIG